MTMTYTEAKSTIESSRLGEREPLTPEEGIIIGELFHQLAREEEGEKIFDLWNELQKSVNDLYTVHPHVEELMAGICMDPESEVMKGMQKAMNKNRDIVQNK